MTTLAPSIPVRSYRSHVAFTLAAAFTLSAAHTIYITAAGIAPDDFSARTPVAWAFYALGFGLTAAARSNRRAAWWVTAGVLGVLIAVSLFVYPNQFGPRLQNTFGWFENDVYVGLLMIAMYLTVQRLRGTTLSR